MSNEESLSFLNDAIAQSKGHSLHETFNSSSFRIFHEIDRMYPSAEQVFSSSLSLMKSASPWLSEMYDSLVQSVIPIRPKEIQSTTSRASFSSHVALGALFLSLPNEGDGKRVDLALSFAHEIGHQVLMIYQRFDPIISSDLRAPVYSGTRDTARPAIMAMHSAVALSYMLATCANVIRGGLEASDLEGQVSRNVYFDLHSRLEKNVHGLLTDVTFTKVGKKMIAEMAKLCESESAKGV